MTCREWLRSSKEDFKNILTYIEHYESNITSSSLELLNKVLEFSVRSNRKTYALVIGYKLNKVINELSNYELDGIIVLDNEVFQKYVPKLYVETICQVCLKYLPEILIFSSSRRCKEIAPYVAAKLKTGIIADCIDFELDKDNSLVAVKSGFGENMIVKIKIPERRPQIITVKSSFTCSERKTNRKVHIIYENFVPDIKDIELINSKKIESNDDMPSLEACDVVIGIGRGVYKNDLEMIKRLALKLKGTLGATKKITDLGWISPSRLIGESGKIIRPKLYIAIGISGAPQHIVGVRSAKTIIAINIDENAPIFKHSDYGVVGDYREIIPKLLKLLEESS